MAQYDRIADDYDACRSSSIGLPTVRGWLELLGWDVDVLDLGCGSGKPIAQAVAGRVRSYVGVDLSAQMASRFVQAVPSARCVVADLAELDLGAEAFDLCFSWGALCHLEPHRQAAALVRMVRHTRPGGVMLFTAAAQAGSCRGWVGPHAVQQHSLGATAYDALLAEVGGQPRFRGEVEAGAAYLYAYTRSAG